MSFTSELLERAVSLLREVERDDLVDRLQQTRQRVADPAIRVVVVGETNQGKSKLINALVNAPVCPVDDDAATIVPTVVGYGDVASAVVVTPSAPRWPTDRAAGNRESVPIGELAAYAAQSGNAGNRRNLIAVEAFLPRTLLRGGLKLVDSPGIGGRSAEHSIATLTSLGGADAFLFVSDAGRELVEPELKFLEQALRMCPSVAFVLSKIDLHPEWRRIAEVDADHLRRLKPGVPRFAVSSDLRLLAAREGDAELNVESGFSDLIRHLRTNVLGRAEKLRRVGVAQDVLSTLDQVRLTVASQLKLALDPASAPEVLAVIENARARNEELRQRSSRWQLTLSDGMADLVSDLEHDLRDRMRAIQREAEDAIDAGDPGPMWQEMADWLDERVSAAISDTFVWTTERAHWLAGEVAREFSSVDARLPDFEFGDTQSVLEPVDLLADLDPGQMGAVEKMLIGMRGSYGGVLMVGLVTSIMGMALINPFSIAAGLLIGTKVYQDDRKTRLKRRQSEAKNLVRRQIDDVIFQVGKQLKDRLRVIQRGTRDHFTDLASGFRRSLDETAKASQAAARQFDATREAEAARLRRLLDRVEQLRRFAQEVAADPITPSGVPARIAADASSQKAPEPEVLR